MKMVKLIILDYETVELHTYSVTEREEDEGYEDLVEEFGHNLSNCHWAVAYDEFKIINH